jgi:hypothetical protein
LIDKADLTNLPSLEDNECHAIIYNIFVNYAPRVPNKKVHQNTFLRLMVERCNFLVKMYLEIQHLRAMNEEKFISKIDKPYSKLFAIFLEECGHICDVNIRQDWGDYPYTYTCLDFDTVDFEILALSDNENWDAIKKSRGLPCLDGQDAKKFPVKLRTKIAPSLGLLDTSKIHTVLSNSKYVLTSDFALKLLLLNEMRKVGRSIILSGDTGVGKVRLFMHKKY